MTRANKKRRATVEASPRLAMVMSLWGTVASMIAAFVLILLSAVIALFCPDPRAVARVAGYVILYASAFVGGFYAYRRCRGYALLCGLYTGLYFTALTLLLSLALSFMASTLGPAWAFLLRLPIIAASVGGAAAGSYSPQRRRHRHR